MVHNDPWECTLWAFLFMENKHTVSNAKIWQRSKIVFCRWRHLWEILKSSIKWKSTTVLSLYLSFYPQICTFLLTYNIHKDVHYSCCWLTSDIAEVNQYYFWTTWSSYLQSHWQSLIWYLCLVQIYLTRFVINQGFYIFKFGRSC